MAKHYTATTASNFNCVAPATVLLAGLFPEGASGPEFFDAYNSAEMRLFVRAIDAFNHEAQHSDPTTFDPVKFWRVPCAAIAGLRGRSAWGVAAYVCEAWDRLERLAKK